AARRGSSPASATLLHCGTPRPPSETRCASCPPRLPWGRANQASSPGEALSLSRLVPLRLDELQPALVDLVGGREKVAPHARRRRELGQCAAESFDRQPAVVTDLAEGFEGFAPRHMSAAGGAAVV